MAENGREEGDMPPNGSTPTLVEGTEGQVSAPKPLPVGSYPLPEDIARQMVPVRFEGRERRPSFQWRD
jgi:hypothetical protein